MVEVVKAKPSAPSKFLIIGEPFSGKTTLAAQAPSPIFISTDGNAARAGLDAINVSSMSEVTEGIKLAIKDKSYKTIVIDTIEGVADLLTTQILHEANQDPVTLRNAGKAKLEALSDVPFGRLTGRLNDKLHSFAEALGKINKNVIILSYTKRQVDEVSGSIILSSELKNIRYITRFIDAQVLTQYDGEDYRANVISKREIMAGQADTSEIDDFLQAIGWDLPKKSVKVGTARRN